jgi:hypothetical protein
VLMTFGYAIPSQHSTGASRKGHISFSVAVVVVGGMDILY